MLKAAGHLTEARSLYRGFTQTSFCTGHQPFHKTLPTWLTAETHRLAKPRVGSVGSSRRFFHQRFLGGWPFLKRAAHEGDQYLTFKRL